MNFFLESIAIILKSFFYNLTEIPNRNYLDNLDISV